VKIDPGIDEDMHSVLALKLGVTPGKANVVVDALSHKAHCNYLPAVCLTREESSTQVLPKLLMFNIILTCLP
jgi:hypothetical protein